MANKKNNKKPARVTSQQEDWIIYKVLIALIAGCFAFLGVRICENNFGYHMIAFYDASLPVCVVALVVAVAAAVLAIVKRKHKLLRRLGVGFLIAALCVAYSAGLMRIALYHAFPLQYFTFVAAAVLYCLYLLYQREFFWISVATACAGYAFYELSRSYTYGVLGISGILTVVVLVIVLLAVAVLTFLCQRKAGLLKLGAWRTLQLTTPLSTALLYLTCAIWLLCLIAGLVLGSLFFYCCMFGAVGYELLVACYYTVKLM